MEYPSLFEMKKKIRYTTEQFAVTGGDVACSADGLEAES
jgi:hypothetical protein